MAVHRGELPGGPAFFFFLRETDHQMARQRRGGWSKAMPEHDAGRMREGGGNVQPGRGANLESTNPRATAHPREGPRSDQVEALLTVELEKLRQVASEYLREDEEELAEGVEGVKRLLLGHSSDDAEALALELDELKELLADCLRGAAERLTREVDRLKEAVADGVYSSAREEE